MQKLRKQTIKPKLSGTPDERTARLKSIWWQMPRYVRPIVYFIYRYIFRLGFLDGRTGTTFHFLQAFWFRLIVDIKIGELLAGKHTGKPIIKPESSPAKFVALFVVLFLLFYYFNIGFLGITSPGKHYNAFLADHLNYIHTLRQLLLGSTAQLLRWFGFTVVYNEYELLAAGRGAIIMAYDCMGLGILSFFSAFVLSYPKKWGAKLIFLVSGIIIIQLLNIIRLALLTLYWNSNANKLVDHHTVFNVVIYIIIAIALYFWIKPYDTAKSHAKN